MPSQDLLFPILPRAPSTPSPDDIKREVTQISQKHQLRKIGTDNGGGGAQHGGRFGHGVGAVAQGGGRGRRAHPPRVRPGDHPGDRLQPVRRP